MEYSIPFWFWVVTGGFVGILLIIIGWLIAKIISDSKNDIENIKKIVTELESSKGAPCANHISAFDRVHQEREKASDRLSEGIEQLNRNTSELAKVISGLSVEVANLKDKAIDQKEDIGLLFDKIDNIETELRVKK